MSQRPTGGQTTQETTDPRDPRIASPRQQPGAAPAPTPGYAAPAPQSGTSLPPLLSALASPRGHHVRGSSVQGILNPLSTQIPPLNRRSYPPAQGQYAGGAPSHEAGRPAPAGNPAFPQPREDPPNHRAPRPYSSGPGDPLRSGHPPASPSGPVQPYGAIGSISQATQSGFPPVESTPRHVSQSRPQSTQPQPSYPNYEEQGAGPPRLPRSPSLGPSGGPPGPPRPSLDIPGSDVQQSDYRMMTFSTDTGDFSVPVDVRAASKVADEKRRRNAGASARFRARRKEREQQSSKEIENLKARVHELREDAEFYRSERNFFRSIVQRGHDAERYPNRPSSPRLRRPRRPAQDVTPGLVTSPTESVGFPYEEFGERGMSGRHVRRRLSEDVSRPAPAAQSYPPAIVPNYGQPPGQASYPPLIPSQAQGGHQSFMAPQGSQRPPSFGQNYPAPPPSATGMPSQQPPPYQSYALPPMPEGPPRQSAGPYNPHTGRRTPPPPNLPPPPPPPPEPYHSPRRKLPPRH